MSVVPDREAAAQEGLCEKCGAEYPIWFAPSPLWNRVMRGGVRANGDMFGFICPTCFANIADEQNGEQLCWVLVEDGRYEEYMREELAIARNDAHTLWERSVALERERDEAIESATQAGETASRQAHNLETPGSTPGPAISSSGVHVAQLEFQLGAVIADKDEAVRLWNAAEVRVAQLEEALRAMYEWGGGEGSKAYNAILYHEAREKAAHLLAGVSVEPQE